MRYGTTNVTSVARADQRDSLRSKVNVDDELADFLKLISTFEIKFSSKIQMLSPIMGESTKIVGESKNSEI